MRKINVQVSRRKINMQRFAHRKNQDAASSMKKNKSARKKFNEQSQFHEEKSQCKSFTKRKINKQRVSLKKSAQNNLQYQNQLATSSMNKVSFTMRKIHKFYEEKNQHGTSFTNKISRQQVPWTKSVSKGEIISVQIYDKKNQNTISFLSKISTNKFHEKQSAGKKFQEQNQFHREKKSN